jgi:heptosyltransferase-1
LAPESKEWQSSIATSPDDDAYVERMMAALPIGIPLLFHTGTTWMTKLWYDQGWQELAELILSRHPDSVILFSWGNREEQERSERIAAVLGKHACVLEQMSLKRFAAILKRCRLVVGGDTGPIHLAAAVGTPTISFYRCTDGARNGPFGIHHDIIQSPLSCSRCMLSRCDRDAECRASITPAAMFASVEKHMRNF